MVNRSKQSALEPWFKSGEASNINGYNKLVYQLAPRRAGNLKMTVSFERVLQEKEINWNNPVLRDRHFYIFCVLAV